MVKTVSENTCIGKNVKINYASMQIAVFITSQLANMHKFCLKMSPSHLKSSPAPLVLLADFFKLLVEVYATAMYIGVH